MSIHVNPTPVPDINCMHCYTTGGDSICIFGSDNCQLQVLDPATGNPVPGQSCVALLRPKTNVGSGRLAAPNIIIRRF